MTGGDLTRSTFDPHRHYSGVRMQQGRVQLDADWNEQLDITAHRDGLEAHDVVGAAGVPKAAAGFEVAVSPDGTDLLLSPGRAWVGGLPCELGDETTDVQDEPATTTLVLASLVLDGVELGPGEWVEVLSATDSRLVRTTSVDVATRTVGLDTSVGPLTGDLRLRRRASYALQPHLPAPEHTTRAAATDPRVLDLPVGTYLACLHAWERTVTSLDDPHLAEPALGVDTTTRSQVVWQVRLLDLAGLPTPVDCASDLGPALATLATGTGRMAARAEPAPGSADLCRPTPAGGYSGLENQLYRVQVHDVDGDRPVLLWSRQNASVVTTWVRTVAADVLEVADIGRDAVLGFGPGDWVELYDDSCVLTDRRGTLVRLLDAKDDRLTLDPATATGSTDVADFGLNPRVRRWDSPGPVTVTGEDWTDLELGVQVRFPAGGTFRPGDHWLVPARSVLADVDWPRDSGGVPLARPPAGIHRDTARLAVVTRTDDGIDVADCRDLFPSLTTLTATDVAVVPETCDLPGVQTVQDALDVLCRSNDLRRHNRLLHGYGIVCGLAVHCGDDSGAEPERDEGQEPVRRFVTVRPGSAIDADGFDLDLPDPVVVDVLDEVAALGEDVLDEDGDGDVCLVLRTDPERGPVVATTPYVARKAGGWLEGTLLHDIYRDCLDALFRWVRAQLTPRRTGDPSEAYLLRTALTNLLTQVANPKSAGTVLVSATEHRRLEAFHRGLRKRLRSQTFCAMFDDARPYPEHPDTLAGIRTVPGTGMHSRARMHPGGREVWTTGGGVNPVRPATLVHRYSLDREALVARIDPVSGSELEHGEKGSTTAAAVTDVAFSPDGRLVYVAVPTRDGHDTLFRVGEVGDSGVRWRPATTICGVRLVTLATTAADPEHVYAAGVRRTSAASKAFGLRQFTGAGIYRIPAGEVPDGLGPIESTASLNTTGHLVVSPEGQAVFTCGRPGDDVDGYDRLAVMSVPGGDVRQVVLDGTGADDLALVPRTGRAGRTTAWVVVGSGADRQVAGFDLAGGEQLARVAVPATGGISLQAVGDRLLVTDSGSSLARVLDTTRHELVDRLRVPVQVGPVSATATPGTARHVVVLNLASNSLTAIDASVVAGDELDLGPLEEYRRAAVESFADLVGGLTQYLKDCVCDHLLVQCPPVPEDRDLELAAVSIRGGSVHRVCNFSRRRYVKSFPTVGYWLSLVPVLPALREAVGRACCALLPEYFGRYSGEVDDEASDRVDAARVLSFLQLVQDEDPMTRLRNLDLGFLASFFKGVNEGDWGDEPEPEPEPVVDGGGGGQPGSGQPGGLVVGPREGLRVSAPEILFRNVLRNPALRREAVREVAAESVTLRRAADVPEPAVLEQLRTRVESLETELAALRNPDG